jgi:hypothetical protein
MRKVGVTKERLYYLQRDKEKKTNSRKQSTALIFAPWGMCR